MKSIYFEVNLPKIALTKALAPFFPSVTYSPLSTLKYGELKDPELPDKSWVKVKSRLCGICGSDMHLILLKVHPKVSLAALPKHVPKGAPKFLGHEVVGEVVEVGEAVSTLAPGDRVVLCTGPCCATMGISSPCAFCEEGHHALCANKSEAKIPANMGGGWSEYFVAHEAQLFKVPEGITDEEAALLEPLSCSLHTVLRRPPEEGEKVLVIGGGIIGLNTVQAARALSPKCEIAILVKYPFQAEAAERLGANHLLYTGDKNLYKEVARITDGRRYQGKFGNEMVLGGFDVIYDCVGSGRTLHDGLRWVRTQGTVVLVGADLDPGRFDYTPLWNQEIELIGSEAHGIEEFEGRSIPTFELAARLILDKKLDLRGLITHKFPLAGYREAIRTLLRRKESKAIKGAFEF
ncbi:MAG: zinc-dependent alcohol dehydrogenase [Planctomycetota bacterium]|jgi:threonine dehydrogenase-like Zn-dependent dehydrogenase